MNEAITTSFDVSDVKRATEPLPEVPYKEAVEALLTTGVSLAALHFLLRTGRRGQSFRLPKAAPLTPLEACTRYHGQLLADVSFHPVVAAVHVAFMDHRPLCLSPDKIWLMIIQGVANHVNAHAEELRPRIVSHQGKITIQVRRDDFVKGSPENLWSEVFNEFSMQIRDHVGEKIQLFVPNFSTTGPVEQAAAEIVLLDAMQSYFEYELTTVCGIPSITLEGTYDDWKGLAQRVRNFRELGLGCWLDVLEPILSQFVRASLGDVDPAFWQSIYRLNGQSGGPVITGWITAFFPYLRDYRTGRATVPVMEFFDGGKRNLKEMLYPVNGRNMGWVKGPTVEELPSGLSKAPFRWDYLDRSFDMEFLGGFVGVSQDKDSLAVQPEIGWAVREAPKQL
jgi:hypothetical protein